MARRVCCLVLLAAVCLQAQLAAAYPAFFQREEEPCTAHPARRYAQHGSPVNDTNIKFIVTDAAGTPVTAVCPGTTYTVTLVFTNRRFALLTSSAGAFDNAKGDCPNRIPLDFSTNRDPATNQTVSLAVPCNAEGSLLLAVTSAKGPSSTFQQSQATVPVGANCPPVPCAGEGSPAAKTAAKAAPAKGAAPKAGAQAAAAPVAKGSATKPAAPAAAPAKPSAKAPRRSLLRAA